MYLYALWYISYMNPELATVLAGGYTYIFLAPATIIFGPIVSVSAGIFVKLGVLALSPTIAALAAGELSADVLWYWLGHHYGEGFVNRFGKYFGITEMRVQKAKHLYHTYNDPIILISKFVGGLTGLSPAMFFTAGLSRVSFRRYMVLNVIGQVFWTGGLLSIGYFLGHLFASINTAFERLSLVALIIFAIIALIGISGFLRVHFINAAEKNPSDQDDSIE